MHLSSPPNYKGMKFSLHFASSPFSVQQSFLEKHLEVSYFCLITFLGNDIAREIVFYCFLISCLNDSSMHEDFAIISKTGSEYFTSG